MLFLLTDLRTYLPYDTIIVIGHIKAYSVGYDRIRVAEESNVACAVSTIECYVSPGNGRDLICGDVQFSNGTTVLLGYIEVRSSVVMPAGV